MSVINGGDKIKKFFSLPEEKQKVIIDAALKCFGANGYKKASVSDIAAAAGISKAMVFHYFGTKKALYFYLVNLCGNIIINEVNSKFDNTVSDFFDRIRQSAEIEMSVMIRHPAMPDFIKSAYYEDDNEVKEDLKALFAQGEGFRNKIALDGVDMSKFKEGVDPKLVVKMLVWLTEGYMNQLPDKSWLSIDGFCDEIWECLDLLKNNLYKPEYL